MRVSCVVLLALTLSVPASSGTDLVFEPAFELHPFSFRPAVAFDGQGRAVAVWGGCAVEVSRSSDNGMRWSPPRLLSRNLELSSDFAFELAFGDGVWVAVWQSNDTFGGSLPGNFKIVYSRSLDHGASWTNPAPLSTPELAKSELPAVATDGAGNWVVVWRSLADMMTVRSADGGASWTTPVQLGSAGTEIEFEFEADLATDGAGTWIAVWPEYVDFFEEDVRFARSTDAGVTWSTPSSIGAGTIDNEHPAIATDGLGNWIIVWDTRDLDSQWGDLDVASSRSTDGGLTWSTAVAVNTNYESDALFDTDEQPQVEADGHGNWLTVWRLDPDVSPLGMEVVGARTSDLGATWAEGQAISERAGDDLWPSLSTDRRGNWLLSWSNSGLLQPVQTLLAPLRLHFAATCPSDLDGDGYGSAGEAHCPLGTAIDCDDTNIRVTPWATGVCDGSSNDCTDPAWPSLAGTNEFDDDGDGLSECGSDCDDSSAQLWAPAGDEIEISLSKDAFGTALLAWSVPSDPGGAPATLRYDTIRNSRPCSPYRCTASCMMTSLCVEADGVDTTSSDSQTPDPGEVFFYVVRAESDCGTVSLRFPPCT